MTDTGIVSAVCDICGAEIREGSDFCYNCGGSLSGPADAAVAAPGEGPAKKGAEAEAGVEPQRPGSTNGVAEKPRRPISRTAHRSTQREIVWEAEERGISPAFLIGTFIFALITAALLIAAYFIR